MRYCFSVLAIADCFTRDSDSSSLAMATPNCFTRERRVWLWGGIGVPQSRLRSRHVGFFATMRAIYLVTGPKIQLFLVGDGVSDVLKALDVYEAVDAIAGCEGSLRRSSFVGRDAMFEVAGDSDVEVLVGTGWMYTAQWWSRMAGW